MRQNRFRFFLTPFIILGVVGFCAAGAEAANEVLKVVQYPTTSNPNDIGNTAIFGIKVEETSGQPDTVQMTYTCVDSANNSLPCSPSSDSLPISKTSWPTDSISVDCTGGVGPTIYFTAYAVGVNGGASYTYNTSTGIAFSGAHPKLAGTPVAPFFLTPTLVGAPTPLQDYSVPVQFSIANVAPAFDRAVSVQYTASYVPTGSSTAVTVPCTPQFETITVDAVAQPITRNVLIHGYNVPAAQKITFNVTANSLDNPGATMTVNTSSTPPTTPVTYTLPATAATTGGTATAAQTVSASSTAGTGPTHLTVTYGPIAATNQYVATVGFPSEASEHLHIFFHAAYDLGDASVVPAHEKYLLVRPDTTEFVTTIAKTTPAVSALQNLNVVIDVSDDVNGSSVSQVLLRVHGKGDHCGPFGNLLAEPSFTFTVVKQ